MKTFLRLGFAIMIVTLFSSMLVVTETRAQNILPEILKRMETHRNSLTSLKTDIKMVKYDALLKVTEKSDIYEGNVTYLPVKGRDALFRVDWMSPAQETLSVVNKKYVIYRPRISQAVTGDADKAKGSGKANNLFAFLNMSKEQLKANYTVIYLGLEKLSTGVETWHLQMTPKNTNSYKAAEMWVDGNGMPIQIKITESNNDTTTVLLTNLQKNTAIKASVFKVDLPKGTKIVNG